MRKVISARSIKLPLFALVLAVSSTVIVAPKPVFATEYSPNFKGTELTEFITIVGKNLKKTIIIDPNVRGKVNVRSYDLLNEEQYYQFFLNVLEVYGYSVVEMENNILKVVRSKDAKTGPVPVVGDEYHGVGDEVVTRVVEVKNVSVRELSPLLRQLANQSGSGNVVNYDPANVIMITGSAGVVNRIASIIRRVDKAGDQNVQIIRLKYASAKEMVRIVESMNKSKGGKSTVPSFLIPKIVADERTNSVIISGEGKARERVVKLIERLDSELESNGNTRVYYLNYSKAEDLVKVLKGVSESIEAESNSSKIKGAKSKSNISIEAHEATNSLVITAQPDMLRSLEEVIAKLDVRRPQVLVEAIIVEVLENDGVNLGVQWYNENGGFTQFNNGPSPISSVVAGAVASQPEDGTSVTTVDSNGNPVTTTNPTSNPDYTLLAQLLGSVNGMMFGIVDNDWGAIVQAVSSDTNSNILATPSITTLDNQEAYFIVGQEIPILTGSTASNNNANPFQTVDRKEVGVKLKVTPQVNEGSGVQLTIEQEVSSVSGATGVDVAINKREIKTTVMADNGATVILGGLIDEDVQESEQKVPLLGDIPVLGHLFKSTSTTSRKRNLMVFLRPTIIRDAKQMNDLGEAKYKQMRERQLQRKEDGLSLMSDEKLPLLKKWQDQLTLPPTYEEYQQQKAQQGKQ